MVRNVGNLITPVSRAGFENGTASLPADLFAHNHQQEQVMKGYSSRPAALVGAGWGGRMADLMRDANGGAALPAAISLDGSNDFLPGLRVTPASVDPVYGPKRMYYLDAERVSASRNGARAASMERILAWRSSDPNRCCKDFAGDSYRSAARCRAAARSAGYLALSAANDPRSSDPGLRSAAVSGGGRRRQLRMAAQLIAARALARAEAADPVRLARRLGHARRAEPDLAARAAGGLPRPGLSRRSRARSTACPASNRRQRHAVHRLRLRAHADRSTATARTTAGAGTTSSAAGRSPAAGSSGSGRTTGSAARTTRATRGGSSRRCRSTSTARRWRAGSGCRSVT